MYSTWNLLIYKNFKRHALPVNITSRLYNYIVIQNCLHGTYLYVCLKDTHGSHLTNTANCLSQHYYKSHVLRHAQEHFFVIISSICKEWKTMVSYVLVHHIYCCLGLDWKRRVQLREKINVLYEDSKDRISQK